MQKQIIHNSCRLYGLILKLYPKSFVREFGDEMEYVFKKTLSDAYSKQGIKGVAIVWARTFTDAGKSAVAQQFSKSKGISMKKTKSDLIYQNKIFLWLAVITGLVLLLPLTVMQFTSEVNWSGLDFAVYGALLFSMSSLYVLAARHVRKSRRLIVALMVGLLLMYMWAELAVGVFTGLGS